MKEVSNLPLGKAVGVGTLWDCGSAYPHLLAQVGYSEVGLIGLCADANRLSTPVKVGDITSLTEVELQRLSTTTDITYLCEMPDIDMWSRL